MHLFLIVLLTRENKEVMPCVGLNRGSCLPGSQPSAHLPAPVSTGTSCVTAPHRCPAPGETQAKAADLKSRHSLCPASSHTAPLALRKLARRLWEKITGARWLEKSGFGSSSVTAPGRALQLEKLLLQRSRREGQIPCIWLRCKELIRKALFLRRGVQWKLHVGQRVVSWGFSLGHCSRSVGCNCRWDTDCDIVNEALEHNENM